MVVPIKICLKHLSCPIVSNLFMEHLEQSAIATVPLEIWPTLWKRYVDDILEIIKKAMSQRLTDHLNQVDKTNNTKFTCEEEKQCGIQFLDALVVKKQDGPVKILVYWKSTHTDQYLHLTLHHPIPQKLGVVRTLLHRCHNLVTENEDREAEEQYIKEALANCGYPDWMIKKVKDQMKTSKENKRKRRKEVKDKNNGLVVIPYIQGISESFSRVLKKHNVSTATRPHIIVVSSQRQEIHGPNNRDCIQNPMHRLWQGVYRWDQYNIKDQKRRTQRRFRWSTFEALHQRK